MTTDDAADDGTRAHEEGSEGASLRLRPLPALSTPAFALDHPYFEIVYAPLIGPTAVLLARAMGRHLHEAGGPTILDATDLALEIGVRSTAVNAMGRRSRLVRAVDRLARNQIIVRQDDRTLGLRTAVPVLDDKRIGKLPSFARQMHARCVERPADIHSGAEPRSPLDCASDDPPPGSPNV